MNDRVLRIGGAVGYWGEAPVATPQFLDAACVDYIIYDYLAEITLSIMARQRAADPEAGFATDFVSAVVKPNLRRIAEQGVKLIANAGGVNPAACARRVGEVAAALGIDVKVAVVEGDDLLGRREALVEDYTDMFTGEPLPPADAIASANAYLGAFPVARALDAGADIVITGRCVDSALALGPCIHEFGWKTDDYARLAAGSLAGHLLECGPQSTGGNFTDWDTLDGPLDAIGYPVAHIAADGAMVITKPSGTSGAVTVGTVSEQLLYEIGDPQAYELPDVVCDFSKVSLVQDGVDRVRVTGATGRAPSPHFKVSVTALDGFRGGTLFTFYGLDAAGKAQAFADSALRRARAALGSMSLPDFSETSVEVLGAGGNEVVVKIAVRHPEAKGVGVLLKTLAGLGLSAPPGLAAFAGGRAKPTPVLRLHSFLIERDAVPATVHVDGQAIECVHAAGEPFDAAALQRPVQPAAVEDTNAFVDVPLIALAWGRSGDKGDKANIGIIARDAEYLPYLWAALTPEAVACRFADLLDPNRGSVDRYLLPGSSAINLLLHAVLGGGGVASLRNDPQGKGYAQLLLNLPVPVPAAVANTVGHR
ncbi:MAG: acyclic terpene utilization AtuA family protein [Pseudomonadota bacterium]